MSQGTEIQGAKPLDLMISSKVENPKVTVEAFCVNLCQWSSFTKSSLLEFGPAVNSLLKIWRESHDIEKNAQLPSKLESVEKIDINFIFYVPTAERPLGCFFFFFFFFHCLYHLFLSYLFCLL